MCREWGLTEEGPAITPYVDAFAALSIARRQGAGKMRHINVKSLWLQEKELRKKLVYKKFKGEDNPADGLTKRVMQELAEEYVSAVSLRLSRDRAEGSLQLPGGGGKKS